MGDDWNGTPSTRRWVHLCMGSEGCTVREEGMASDRPRRIAQCLKHVDAEEITEAHNRAVSSPV